VEDDNVGDRQRRPYQHKGDGPARSAGPPGNAGACWWDRRRRISRDGVISVGHGRV